MAISLTINGIPVEAQPGMTVLDAARQRDIFIPTLCYHEKLPPFGACRLCVVEIDGVRGLPTACTIPVSEGMVVRTETPALQQLRREVLALILSEHPYTCLVCERRNSCSEFQGTIRKAAVTTGCQYCPKNGACDLQKIAAYVGLEEVPYPIAYRGLSVERFDPYFDRDYNLCILCGRCVRVCQDVRLIGALAFTERGDKALVGTAFGRPHLETECEFCGSCVDVCPTGALAERASKWEGAADVLSPAICPHCAVGCTLDVHVKEGRVIRTTANAAGPVNAGEACVHGRFRVAELVNSDQRLLTPLIRKGSRLVRASWDEVLDLAATRLAQIEPGRVALLASAGSTNEESYVLQKFARAALGVNHIDVIGGLPGSPSTADLIRAVRGLTSDAAHFPIERVATAECVFVIGADLNASHPILALQVRRALRRGARLVVIDPQPTRLADRADVWLQPRSGTDHVVLVHMMKAILGLGAPAWERKAEPIEPVSGVARDRLVEAARLWATSATGAIIYGTGVTRHPHALETIKAIQALVEFANHGRPDSVGVVPAVGGASMGPGLGANLMGAYDMGLCPVFLPHYIAVDDAEGRAWLERAWGCSLPAEVGLGYAEILQGARDGRIDALYLVGRLPAGEDLPDLPLLIVQDSLPGPHVERAHIVLPAATFAETGGSYTNLEGRVQIWRPAIPPRGESRPGWAIPCQVAQRLEVAGFTFEGPEQIIAEARGLARQGVAVDGQPLMVNR